MHKNGNVTEGDKTRQPFNYGSKFQGAAEAPAWEFEQQYYYYFSSEND